MTADTGRTVAVAMSGGVDSSVAAAMLVEAGANVFGIMLRLWAEPGAAQAGNRCCTLGAVDDARAVADVLNIPFSVIDIRDAFKATVVDAFLAAAAAGDTPNPCFTCNRSVRFGLLLDSALALGADALATGHYARTRRRADGAWELLRGVDPTKDQSYVLHALDQAQLGRARFPLGESTKVEVRAMAERFGLPVAQRPDSVDLCWTAMDGVAGFLGRHLPPERMAPGDIVDVAGHVLGRHAGLPRYTIGQRRGLGVAGGAPLFVVDRDRARNTLVVGPPEALAVRDVFVRRMRWSLGAAPAAPLRVTAQVRYRAAAASALLVPLPDGGARVTFDAPVRAPAPGQGLVAWIDDDRVVLGGGLIARETPAAPAAADAPDAPEAFGAPEATSVRIPLPAARIALPSEER